MTRLNFIGVNISERKSGTERTKKHKKRELVFFPAARGCNWYFNTSSRHYKDFVRVTITWDIFIPVSRFECVSGLSVYWPIIALGTRECGVAKLCRDPTVQSKFFLRVSLLKTFNLIYCYGELIVSIVVSAIAVFRLVDNNLSSSLHC